jgi:hypothetical protein
MFRVVEPKQGMEEAMQPWFSFRALALIQLLLGGVGFLHAEDWMSKKSSAPNYGNMKIKQVVHSFDYRESNRKIGID